MEINDRAWEAYSAWDEAVATITSQHAATLAARANTDSLSAEKLHPVLIAVDSLWTSQICLAVEELMSKLSAYHEAVGFELDAEGPAVRSVRRLRSPLHIACDSASVATERIGKKAARYGFNSRTQNLLLKYSQWESWSICSLVASLDSTSTSTIEEILTREHMRRIWSPP